LKAGSDKTTVRLSDFMGIIPAITGKVELVYEGEQETFVCTEFNWVSYSYFSQVTFKNRS
jgi:magnesium chelatase subunit I